MKVEIFKIGKMYRNLGEMSLFDINQNFSVRIPKNSFVTVIDIYKGVPPGLIHVGLFDNKKITLWAWCNNTEYFEEVKTEE